MGRTMFVGVLVMASVCIVAAACSRKKDTRVTDTVYTNEAVQRIVQTVAADIEQQHPHIFERTTFPPLPLETGRRLDRISMDHIAALERIMETGTMYEKEVVVFGVELHVQEGALRASHPQFVTNVYAFLSELKEARSRTTPPGAGRRILYDDAP